MQTVPDIQIEETKKTANHRIDPTRDPNHTLKIDKDFV